VALSDPSRLAMTDELALLLGKKLQIRVATCNTDKRHAQRAEQSQRVLDEATVGFTGQAKDQETKKKISRSITSQAIKLSAPCSLGRHGDLHGPRAPRKRCSHRDLQFRSSSEIGTELTGVFGNAPCSLWLRIGMQQFFPVLR